MIFVLAVLFSSHGSGQAQNGVGPFERLAGQWVGSGTIELSNGPREPIKCRAAYDVLEERHGLQLNIRCASDSYNFELLGSVTLASGAIGGTWTETTHNAAGLVSGRAEGDRIQLLAKSAGFSAALTLVTQGDRQSVVIKSLDANTAVKGASITLHRS